MIERALIAAVLALAALLGLQTLRLADERTDHQATKAQAAEDRVTAASALTELQGQYRQVETNLTAALTIEREQANEARTHHARRVDVLLGRLRDAQARAAATPNVPGTPAPAAPGKAPSGGDEPLVPRQIGEEDVFEAGRAEDIRTALLGCYRSYDRARAEIEAVK